MATRQELFTAIGLIRQTCRMNRHRNSLIFNLQGLGDYSEPEEPDGFTPFERQKKASEVPCNIIYDISGKLKIFLESVDSKYLDVGIDAIHVAATQLKIISDVQTSNTLSADAKPFIELASTMGGLADLSGPFEKYIPECGIDEPDPWVLFSKEINHANILHDILDAMSYELQGRNSYTGDLHNYDAKQMEKLINNRVFTANVYLNRLPNNTDTQQMRDVVQFVEENFGKLADAILGQYIDSNIPKQIIVRRWWVL